MLSFEEGINFSRPDSTVGSAEASNVNMEVLSAFQGREAQIVGGGLELAAD